MFREQTIFSSRFICVLIGAAVFLWSTYVRYARGLNQSPVHIKLSDADLPDDYTVSIRSIFNSESDLLRTGNIWTTHTSRPPVAEIFVSGPDRPDPDSIEIRLGFSWLDFFRSDHARELVPVPELHPTTWKVVLPEHSRSFISRFSAILNWQGDAWLLLPPFLTGVLAATLSFILLTAVNSAGDSESTARPRLLLFRYVLAIFSVLAGVFLCIYIYTSFSQLVSMSDGRTFAIATGMVLLVLTCTVLLTRWLTNCEAKTLRRIQVPEALFWGGVLAAKLVFVSSSSVHLTGDFKDYQALGEAFAAGNVESIWDHDYILLPVLATRAYAFCAPIIWLFGADAMPYANCVFQILTAGMISRIAVHAGAGRYRLLAAAVFLLWPDFLFSTPITNHDIPGYFLTVCCLSVFLGLQRRLTSTSWQQCGSFRKLAELLCWAVAYGALLAVLEWARNFSQFLIVGALYSILLNGNPTAASAGLIDKLKLCGFLLLAIAAMSGTSRILSSSYTIHGGKPYASNLSLAAALSSSRTEGGSIWINTVPYRFTYFPAVPSEQRPNLIRRKLLHEKLVLAGILPDHLRRKTLSLADDTDYISSLFFEYFPESEMSDLSSPRSVEQSHRYLQLSKFIALLCTLLAASVSLAHLIQTALCSFSDEDWLTHGTTLTQLSAVILLSDSAATYDATLGISSALAAAIFCSRLKRATTISARRNGQQLLRIAVSGSLCLLLIWGAAVAAGRIVQRTNSAFVDLNPQSVTFTAGESNFNLHRTSSAVALRLKDSAETDASGCLGEILISPLFAEDRHLVGFLTGNQYLDSQPSRDRYAPGIAQYQFCAGDQVIHEGDLADLNSAKWLDFTIPGNKPLKLRLSIAPNLTSGQLKEIPAIAIEYLWSPAEQQKATPDSEDQMSRN